MKSSISCRKFKYNLCKLYDELHKPSVGVDVLFLVK